MNLLPNKQLLLNVPIQSTKNIERKNCVWTTKYMRLLEMCIVQHVEVKCVCISTNKNLVTTIVKSAMPAATF